MFTVFTPTFNRCHTLERVFNSLVNQTIRNFEWLIIDDGSTDETERLISDFTKVADFPVRYYKQINSGKHIAINNALSKAEGEWFFTLDSDDFLAENCLETCENLAKEAKKENFSGYTFIHAPEKLYGHTTEYGNKRCFDDKKYSWSFAGEMVFVFKTDIIQKYPFPVFEKENFCQESVQLIPIINNHKILYTDHILAFGEYLEDGLSKNLYQRLLNNPRYAMLSFKTKLSVAKSRSEKEFLARNYWDVAMKAKHLSVKDKLMGIPIKWTVIEFFNKIKNRWKIK